MLIVVALVGAVTPILVAAFDRNSLWHEGVDGFFVAVVCSIVVARSERGTWQQRVAKALLILGAVIVVVVIGLAVLWVSIASKHGFTGM